MQTMQNLKQAAIDRLLASRRLNPPQQEAVRTVNGPVVVLAGAGSGKTTAIVNRIAYMMQFGDTYNTPLGTLTAADTQYLTDVAEGKEAPDAERLAEIVTDAPIPGWSILAITFTNKAAAELKSRLETMLGDHAATVWAATFHSACVRILRQHIDRLGYERSFTIYDADDSRRVVSACFGDLSVTDPYTGAAISEKAFPPKVVAGEISKAKDRLISPAQMLADADGDYRTIIIAKLYQVYQMRLKDANAVDFDDIIALTVRLFQEHPDVLDIYQNRCRYLLVDEYQDTNTAQYELIRLLAGKYRNLCVVGDDDQSIYKFRGATIENILSFEKQFPDCRVIRLEQNYRSTGRILAAANSVIRNNTERKEKTLWTASDEGDRVFWFKAADQNEEATFVTDTILERIKAGGSYGDHAVLYRTHALSNTIERHLSQAGIPYRVYGGLRFFDRKEVKDMVSYLSVINNPHDMLRFRRIINEPKRGIGNATLDAIEQIANDLHLSPIEVLRTASDYPVLSRKAAVLRNVGEMFDTLMELADTLAPDALYDRMRELTGYDAMLSTLGDEGQTRLENVEELKSSILQYMEAAEEPTLGGFLEEISLYTDQDRADESNDAVTLMTIHAAKGLEYDTVFLVGMDDGVFPNTRWVLSPQELEEERRLAYVAITRAKRRLYLVNAARRMLHGMSASSFPSRFIKEISPECIEKHSSEAIVPAKGAPIVKTGSISLQQQIVQQKSAAPKLESFAVGEQVRHSVFGVGTVLSVLPTAGDAMLEIAFEKVGTKKVMAKYARIKKI